MNGHNGQKSDAASISEAYERQVLEAFKTWYWQENPTIKEASAQAFIIARDTVNALTATQVICLLQEHSEWTYQEPQEKYDSDKHGVTIGEIARRHFVKHLEKIIQSKGLEAAYIYPPAMDR